MNTIAGITYSEPQVMLLQETGIGTSEVAARTCYDSFDSSENDCIEMYNNLIERDNTNETLEVDNLSQINNIEHSDLLDKLAWTHFHRSILEHASLTYLIRGTSRGALQEHARHRIQSISVRSTRYTMQNILHAFNACSVSLLSSAKYDFTELIKPMDMFVVQGVAATIEIHGIYDRLHHQLLTLGSDAFGDLSLSKSAKEVYAKRLEPHKTSKELYDELITCKSKRNVGDSFKWVVTDNWKVDMVVTFNLRSLKNYFDLRDSGAAYFQIRSLAQAMKSVTPSKYLDLIVKPTKENK